MAISKMQNERPAISSLIDLANALEVASNEHAGDIETLTDSLADEVSARKLAIAGIDSEVTNLQSDVGQQQRTIDTISGLVTQLQIGLGRLSDAIKIGATEEITVPANDTYSGSYTYQISYPDTSKSFVILGIAENLSQGTLELTLIDSTYSGFSYSITNTDAEPATVTIGYLAVKVG